VKEHQDSRRITVRSDRAFSAETIDIYRLKLHIISDRPDGTDIVEPLAPLGPANGSRLGP
jgi:hypothetical protein